MGHTVDEHDDAAAVLAEAGTFLESRPVEHNLVLTLLAARVASPEPGRYWIVRDGDEPVGLGFLSPVRFAITVTPMPEDAVDALVDAAVDAGAEPIGVSGEAGTAARAVGQWTERTGRAARPDMGMRIYRLGELAPPTGVPGRLRTATTADTDVVLEMIEGFHRDTGEPSILAAGVHEGRIADGAYVVWEVDGEVVSMAGRTPPVAGMSRIYAVFTPPELRQRGYAAAATAALATQIREEGSDAMLFTDLGNPISNSVYRRIGFRAVAENLRYLFR